MAANNSMNWVGLILAAVVVGLVAGIFLINPNYVAPPSNVEVDPKDLAYDHARDGIPKVSSAKVTHILISWKGKNAGVKPKDPERTEQQAKKLAEEIWAKYHTAKDSEKDKVWKELQKQHNEDSGDVHKVYDVTPTAGLVQEFKDCALTTAVGKVRIALGDGGPAKLTFGYHVIRRIE